MPQYPEPVTQRMPDLPTLDEQVPHCRACPRLVEWRERVAAEKRAAYRDEQYWGKPVPGFGPQEAALAVVGLAPAAHGGNRTGRVFTGDRSGDMLFAALHDVGLANQATSTHRGDGLELHRTRILAPVKCAPPRNKPTPAERDTCRPWMVRELELLSRTLRAMVVLGGFGWQALLPVLADAGYPLPRPRPKFGHGAHVQLAELHLLGCYHVSQQNTFTGKLTQAMLGDVLARAAWLAGIRPSGPRSHPGIRGPQGWEHRDHAT